MIKYLGMVLRNKDNIEYVFQPERPVYPIPHWDSSLLNGCQSPPYHFHFDLYVSNQSKIIIFFD